MTRDQALIDRLAASGRLEEAEYAELLDGRSEEGARCLAERAAAVRRSIYGDEVFTRGLIEISSYCRNNCLYCGIRRGNERARRYRLTRGEILDCAEEGYGLGFRTFVLQGGEDPYFTDEVLCDLIAALKARLGTDIQ